MKSKLEYDVGYKKSKESIAANELRLVPRRGLPYLHYISVFGQKNTERHRKNYSPHTDLVVRDVCAVIRV